MPLGLLLSLLLGSPQAAWHYTMLLAAPTHQLLNLQLRTAQATDLQCHHSTAEGDKTLMLQCMLHKTSDKKA